MVQHWHCLDRTGDSCLLRLMLPASSQIKPNCGGFSSHGAPQFQPLGKLLFIPHGTEFHLRHDAGEQKALVCLFDPSSLGVLGSYRWNWQDNVSAAMLNLQSGYLHASLQRLAEEVANPGFASELHTECLLTSIALDLRREFIDAPDDATCSSHCAENSAIVNSTSCVNCSTAPVTKAAHWATWRGPANCRCGPCPVAAKTPPA